MEKKRILSAGGSRLQIDKENSTEVLTGPLTYLFIRYVSLPFTVFYAGLLTFEARDIYAMITGAWMIVRYF